MQALADENAAAPPAAPGKAATPAPMARRRALGDLTNVRGATPAPKAGVVVDAQPSARPPRPAAAPALPRAALPRMTSALAPPDQPEALAGLPLAAQTVLAEDAAEAAVAARVAAVCAGAARYGGGASVALPPAFTVLDEGDRPPSEPGSPARLEDGELREEGGLEAGVAFSFLLSPPPPTPHPDWATDAAPSPPSLDDALASLLAAAPSGSPAGDSVVVGSDTSPA